MSVMERLNSNFLEKIILKGMLSDKDFLVLVSSVFEENYFDDPNISHSFKFCQEYVDQYHRIPDKDAIINSSENPNDIREVIDESVAVDFDVANSYEFLLAQTNDYLKEKALKRAIIDSVDDVEDPERRNDIQKRIENALIKDIKVDLGLRYFEQMRERLKRIFETSENRIPTYFPLFDELINGGFPPYTFNVLTAKIHGGKSNTMANFAARQVLHGHNVALLTLEMSEDAFAQRFDGIYSGLDINRMYLSRSMKRSLIGKLAEHRRIENRGELFIKQYPTGDASIADFRIYLRELMMRSIKVDIVYVDYINLMKSAYKVENNMYSSIKRVSEELRALALEFNCPIVSVSQLNREGFFIQFSEVNFNHIAESMGIPATADFMAIMGTDEEQMIYESEILYKITKSRIGGRVGAMEKFYLDKRSLKMYDGSELDLWIEEASISGDDRELLPEQNEETDGRRRRRRRD
jgi:replicative DNA helicase